MEAETVKEKEQEVIQLNLLDEDFQSIGAVEYIALSPSLTVEADVFGRIVSIEKTGGKFTLEDFVTILKRSRLALRTAVDK